MEFGPQIRKIVEQMDMPSPGIRQTLLFNATFLHEIQVTKEELASKEELGSFRKHVTSLAALDFLVCLKSDVIVMTYSGNFTKLIIGARWFADYRSSEILGSPSQVHKAG